MAVVPRLLGRYRSEIVAQLKEELGCPNELGLPRLEKVVISQGLGKAVAESGSKLRDSKRFQEAEEQLRVITGQQPVVTRARKSVSNFKVREGWEVGLKVTLRGARMYEFLDRLVSLAIPRVRDFRGLSPQSFDGRGNYNLGLSEQTVFPEVDLDKVTYQQGMNICIVTSAKGDAEARSLLTKMGMPFRS
jgi:large subunit ribosomal protein L5